jgi:hypothetical protein
MTRTARIYLWKLEHEPLPINMEGIDILTNELGVLLGSGELRCRLPKKLRKIGRMPNGWSERRSRSDIERLCDLEGFGPGLMSD